MLNRAKFLLSRILFVFVLEPDAKGHKIRACIRGTYYGLLGNMDKQFDEGVHVF